MAVASSRIFVLCDTANVREGLLNVLAAGISSIYRPGFPATLDCHVAIQFQLESAPAEDKFLLRVEITGSDGEDRDIHPFEQLLNDEPFLAPAESGVLDFTARTFNVPFVLNASALVLPSAGSYRMDLLVNGERLSRLRFDAFDTSIPVDTPGDKETTVEALG